MPNTLIVTLDKLRDRIAKRIDELKLSWSALAHQADIDRNTIRGIVDGRIQDPGWSKIVRLMGVLGMGPDQLLDSEAVGRQGGVVQLLQMIESEMLFSETQKEELRQYINRVVQVSNVQFKRLLVVDDQPIFLKGVEAFLTARGYEVVPCDGFVAVERMAGLRQMDMAIVDYDLGGQKTGLDVLRFLKAEVPNLPFVMLSGMRNSDAVKEAMALGAFDYVDKEDDLERLIYVIKRAEEFTGMAARQSLR